MGIRTQRSVVVDASPAIVWEALQRVEEYPTWWPWLLDFQAERLAPGARWTCRIRTPLPWPLRLTLDLSRVEPGHVEASLSGDVAGTASITVDVAASGGATIQLRSVLRPEGGATGALHRLAPGLSRRAHDQVMDRALAQFRARALP